MKEERPDASLFIGLHKLAEQNGDGLVPELYALLSERAQAADMTMSRRFPAAVGMRLLPISSSRTAPPRF